MSLRLGNRQKNASRESVAHGSVSTPPTRVSCPEVPDGRRVPTACQGALDMQPQFTLTGLSGQSFAYTAYAANGQWNDVAGNYAFVRIDAQNRCFISYI